MYRCTLCCTLCCYIAHAHSVQPWSRSDVLFRRHAPGILRSNSICSTTNIVGFTGILATFGVPQINGSMLGGFGFGFLVSPCYRFKASAIAVAGKTQDGIRAVRLNSFWISCCFSTGITSVHPFVWYLQEHIGTWGRAIRAQSRRMKSRRLTGSSVQRSLMEGRRGMLVSVSSIRHIDY